jgi:hypothetical protein
MRSDHYVHPDFGCFAPTSRFRRELRIGFLSMVFGVGVGVAVTVGTRHQDHASLSAAETRGAVAGATASTQAPPDATPDKTVGAAGVATDGTATKGINTKEVSGAGTVVDGMGKSGVHRPPFGRKAPDRALRSLSDMPPIARLPLGRADSSAEPTPAGDRAASGPRGTRMPEHPQTNLRHEETTPVEPDRTPVPPNRPERTVRRQKLAPDAHGGLDARGNERTDRDTEGRGPSARRAYARDGSSSPKGFWAWSW